MCSIQIYLFSFFCGNMWKLCVWRDREIFNKVVTVNEGMEEKASLINPSNTVALPLIASAGNAHAYAKMAIDAARHYDFNQADTLVDQAKDALKSATQWSNQCIQCKDLNASVDLIMVHAQDHLTIAMNWIEQAQEFIEIYRQLHALLHHDQ